MSLLRIRTITTGVSMVGCVDESALVQAIRHNELCKSVFESHGYTVQTTRITTNSFEDFLDCSSLDTLLEGVRQIDEILARHDSNLISLGPARTEETIRFIPDIIAVSTRIFVSAAIKNEDFKMAEVMAETCLRISRETPGGQGNFQVAAAFNCEPGIPFFPAGYHALNAPPTFAIGLEVPGLLVKGLKAAEGDLCVAEKCVYDAMCKPVMDVESTAILASDKARAEGFAVDYAGIDASIAPSVETSSIIEGFESLGGPFGTPGTLAICSIITRAIKSLPVKICGYSGLMLPPMEDVGLAKRASEGLYTLPDLLSFSAVCGVGLDTVPISGYTSSTKIAMVYLDVAALAFRLRKPLTARLFPCVGIHPQTQTKFDHPNLCNTTVFNIL